MQVILHDDIAQQVHSLSLMEKSPGIQHDFNQVGASEDRLPAHDRTGGEVGESRLTELVATSTHIQTLLARVATKWVENE